MSMNPQYGGVGRLAKIAVVLVMVFPVASQARAVKLLIFGDSLAAGYGLPQPEGFQAQLAAALKANGHQVSILDGGVSGDTTAGGRARLDWALADKPDAVLLELGANDGLRGTSTADMEANLTAMLDTLAAQRIPALLSGMEAPPNMGAAYTSAFRAVFAKLGKRPGLLFDPFFLEGVAANPALNQADHIHPNAEGVRRVVARIKPAVEKLLAEVPE